MKLFGSLHLAILLVIALTAIGLILLVRCRVLAEKLTCRVLGLALATNEVIWWVSRYSREGIHSGNLPLQLCDAAVWFAVAACLTSIPAVIEFGFFAGLAGAGMALLTPNLIAPWPQYPAVYFFLAHGGIVVCVVTVVFGRNTSFPSRAVWRSFGLLLSWTAFVGLVDAVTGANYMFLVRKPDSASLLDFLGPWPWYLVAGAAIALLLFACLWWLVRLASPRAEPAGFRASGGL